MHNDEYSAEDRKFYEPLPMNDYTVIGPKNFGFSTDIYDQIVKIKPDVVHTQTIWMYLSHANKDYHKKTGTPYVVAPRGMLDPWQLKQSAFKKKLALMWYENKHLHQASCMHALAQDEYDSIRKFGLKNPVAILPNGVDLPVIDPTRAPNVRWENKEGRKTLIFLSRVHAKKGLENLLQAWALTNPATHNWQLAIAGETKDTAYVQLLTDMVKNLNIGDTVQFIGGQFGQNKQDAFLHADAFTLPSFSEGLPMAVLEAWSYRLPAVITQFCNLPEGFTHNAAIKIETNPDSIAEGFKKLFSMTDEERAVMGNNGFDLVKSKFTWHTIAGNTLSLYKWLTGDGAKPEFVLT